MIIMKLQGGLGNQMFQYAAGYALAKRLGVELKLDITSAFGEKAPDRSRVIREYMLAPYTVQAAIAGRSEIAALKGRLSLSGRFPARAGRVAVRNRLLLSGVLFNGNSRYCEAGFEYNQNFFNIADNTYLEGYFQSQRYFEPVADEIQNTFFGVERQCVGKELLGNILVKNGFADAVNTVAAGVRRGELVSNYKLNRFHGVCDCDYFRNAFRYFECNLEEPVYVVFSDDIPWCKNNLSDYPDRVIFIDKVSDVYELLMLFSSCKHSLISNSSYFWWGAWLNCNVNKKIIAPEHWFSAAVNTVQLIPRTWMRM